ncbi:substrate-binding domain-containing protein [Paracoccus mutanolyticus]|uniref:substrate-binding domain-containing protein n=1 Tax=Paracoccus mutanolyticus TaxID=1499308 RepID=UPI001CB8D5A7|nr:substrate-binding domain-containing protein [Paracoccus mutanolyticus]
MINSLDSDDRRMSSAGRDAQGDIARQQSQIENFVASGVDGIITMLVDADSGRAMSKIAEQAGVPLVFVNMLRSFAHFETLIGDVQDGRDLAMRRASYHNPEIYA